MKTQLFKRRVGLVNLSCLRHNVADLTRVGSGVREMISHARLLPLRHVMCGRATSAATHTTARMSPSWTRMSFSVSFYVLHCPVECVRMKSHCRILSRCVGV